MFYPGQFFQEPFDKGALGDPLSPDNTIFNAESFPSGYVPVLIAGDGGSFAAGLTASGGMSEIYLNPAAIRSVDTTIFESGWTAETYYDAKLSTSYPTYESFVIAVQNGGYASVDAYLQATVSVPVGQAGTVDAGTDYVGALVDYFTCNYKMPPTLSGNTLIATVASGAVYDQVTYYLGIANNNYTITLQYSRDNSQVVYTVAPVSSLAGTWSSFAISTDKNNNAVYWNFLNSLATTPLDGMTATCAFNGAIPNVSPGYITAGMGSIGFNVPAQDLPGLSSTLVTVKSAAENIGGQVGPSRALFFGRAY